MNRLVSALCALLLAATCPALADTAPTSITFACGAATTSLFGSGAALPPLTVVSGQTGTSKTFGTAAANCGTAQIRSNSGTSMTDTLVAPATLGANWYFYIANADATATDTITAATGTITGPSGAASTLVIQPGESGIIATDGTNAFVVSGTLGAARASFNPASPGPIGGTTPSSGSFTTLQAGVNTPNLTNTNTTDFAFSANAISAVPIPVSSIMQVTGTDATTARLTVVSFGAQGNVLQLAAGGTAAIPTALSGSSTIGTNNFGGYNGTTWNVSAGQIISSSQNIWTAGDNSTNMLFKITPVSSITLLTLADLDASTSSVALGGPISSESLRVPNVASAVNHIQISGATTTNSPVLSTAGSDTSVPLNITPQGTGTTVITKNGLTLNGELTSTQATLPTVASCGTGSPAVTANSSDLRGSVTTGTAASSCVITFKGSPAFATAPFCVVSGTSIVSFPAVTAVSATTLTLGISAAVTGDVITWHCIQ